jgi:hypothetical protein
MQSVSASVPTLFLVGNLSLFVEGRLRLEGQQETGVPDEINEPPAIGDCPALEACPGWRVGGKPAILAPA